MQFWLVVAGIFFAVYSYKEYQDNERNRRIVAAEVACKADPVCRDAKANDEASWQSIRQSKLIRSATGVVFFKGSACSDDCTKHLKGYFLAKEKGVSKNAGCVDLGKHFYAGCVQYVVERVAELKDERADEDDGRGSCTPGRYGDC